MTGGLAGCMAAWLAMHGDRWPSSLSGDYELLPYLLGFPPTAPGSAALQAPALLARRAYTRTLGTVQWSPIKTLNLSQ